DAIQSAETFYQWYHDVEGVNQAIDIVLTLEETAAGSGQFVFDDDTFFPIDGQGFGDSGCATDGVFDEGACEKPHNFHFTTEVRTHFIYQPGQSFTFTGDDDLWLFI